MSEAVEIPRQLFKKSIYKLCKYMYINFPHPCQNVLATFIFATALSLLFSTIPNTADQSLTTV